MRRLIPLLLLGLLAAGVVSDGYVFRGVTGDVVSDPSPWKVLLGVLDVGLLAATVWLVWLNDWSRALSVLVIEGVFTVLINVAFVRADGLDRYATGFDGEGHSVMMLLLGVRFALLFMFVTRSRGRSVPISVGK